MVEIDKKWIIVGVALIVILLVWGIVGGMISSDAGISCTFGSDGNFCWAWEKNLIGEVGDALNKVFG